MLRVQNGEVPLDLDLTMGLGWLRTELVAGGPPLTDAGQVAWHNGATLLYNSQLITLLDHQLGVVVLANSSTAGILVNQVAIEALKLALLAKTGLKEPEPEKPSPKIALSSDELKKQEGYYNTDAGVMALRVRHNRLHAKLKQKPLEFVPLVFVPHANGNYSLRVLLADFIPIRIKMLEAFQFSFEEIAGYQGVILHQGNKGLFGGEKLAPVPISDAWKKREGKWEVVNPGEDALVLQSFRIKQENDFLIAQVKVVALAEKINWSYALAPVSDTEAIIMGLGRRRGETIHVVTVNGEERLQYSGFEFRRKP